MCCGGKSCENIYYENFFFLHISENRLFYIEIQLKFCFKYRQVEKHVEDYKPNSQLEEKLNLKSKFWSNLIKNQFRWICKKSPNRKICDEIYIFKFHSKTWKIHFLQLNSINYIINVLWDIVACENSKILRYSALYLYSTFYGFQIHSVNFVY